MTKMGQKLIKKLRKIASFLYIFRICSLKIFVGGGLGGGTAPSVIVGLTQGSHAIAEIARDASRSTGQKTVRMTRQSVKRVIPKTTSWKSRGARAPVPHSWRRQC